MTDPPLSTMAHPAAADPPRATQQPSTSSSTPPASPATKFLLKREFDLTLRAFFPTPTAPMKFHAIGAMNQLLRTMLKDESSLVLRTPSNDRQLELALASLPTGENEFKKFFKVTTTRNDNRNQTHVCIGCHVLSSRNLSNIKFRSKDNNLLTWLKKANVFIESDSLGIDRPVTIGYFTKIDPLLTHLANFRDELYSDLSMIDIDVDTAVAIAPHLKTVQLEAMTNGDDFTPSVPNFEVYRTKISHGRDPSKVTTDVIGVKGSPKDAKLLTEFFTRQATDGNNDQRNGVFIPKGMVNLIGPSTFEQALKNNNFFLTTVATVPVNLTFDAWFSVIDPNQTAEEDPISLHDHLLRHSWFIRLEPVTRNKTIIVTTKSNLSAARAWVDENLEPMIRKSIQSDTEPLPSQALPRRLDKPTYTATSRTYADILKQQFSLAPIATKTTTDITRPPRKRQATVIDYDSDPESQSSAVASTPSTNNPPPRSSNSTSSHPTMTTAYATDMQSIRNEIQELRNLLTHTVEQIKLEIASILPQVPSASTSSTKETNTPTTSNMETEVEPPTENTSDLSDLIAGLKNDIATKLDISDLILDLKWDLALIKSHPLFCHLKPIDRNIPVT